MKRIPSCIYYYSLQLFILSQVHFNHHRYHVHAFSARPAKNGAASIAVISKREVSTRIINEKQQAKKIKNGVVARNAQTEIHSQNKSSQPKKTTQNRNKRHRNHSNSHSRNSKPGPYHDLSSKEVQSITNKLLSAVGPASTMGKMTPGQAHEAGRLIISWCKSHVHAPQSGKMSEKLLRRLVEERRAGNDNAKPSLKLFNSCMDAWTMRRKTDKNRSDNGYMRALGLLKYLNEYIDTYYGAENCADDDKKGKNKPKQEDINKCYHKVLDGCFRAKTKASADVARKLLDEMDPSGRHIKYYNAVLNIYASINDHKSVLDLFNHIKSMKRTTNKDGTRKLEWERYEIIPNRMTYNIVIKALSGCNDIRCIRRAEEVLVEMEHSQIQPDKISYTSILSAWSRVCNKQAVEKAEMYLGKMYDLYMAGNDKVKPDLVTYNIVLNIIANTKSLDASLRSSRILQKMELLYELGDEELKPNLVSYNAVIKAFSNSALDDGARRAFLLLKKLENNECSVQPDIISYNSCLNAFAKAKDPIAAQLLLEQMENMYQSGYHVKPDTYSYNTVISAWAFSGHDHGAEIAETIFDRMETSQIKLDTTTFNTLLSAWSLQKDPERATDILHHMFIVKKSGQYDVRPTIQSFAIVINAWAKATYPRKAFKARQLLEEMNERSAKNKRLKPNAYIYASILNACAFSFGTEEVRKEALTIAIEVFRECKNRNDVVYGSFIKVCGMLMDEEDYGARRTTAIKTVFRDCKKHGVVSDFVLRELYSSLSLEEYVDITGLKVNDVALTVKDVPKSWKRNITKR